jgi:hypothetical protein
MKDWWKASSAIIFALCLVLGPFYLMAVYWVLKQIDIDPVDRDSIRDVMKSILQWVGSGAGLTMLGQGLIRTNAKAQTQIAQARNAVSDLEGAKTLAGKVSAARRVVEKAKGAK